MPLASASEFLSLQLGRRFDEMDEVHGSGNAEMLDDGTLEIEFAYHNGDEAILIAKPMPFSAAWVMMRASKTNRCTVACWRYALDPHWWSESDSR